LIRSAGKKNQFSVREMTADGFFDIAGLLKTDLQLRKVQDDGNPVNWREIKWLHYEKSKPGIVQYKTSLDESPFKTLNLSRRGRNNVTLKPKLKYTEPNKITKEKKQDLINLLQFISPVFHQFYKDLTTSDSARNTHPDTIEDKEIE
jgi:hypothetical protein